MFGEIRRWRRNDGVQRSVGHLMTCSVDTCLHTLYDLGVQSFSSSIRWSSCPRLACRGILDPCMLWK